MADDLKDIFASNLERLRKQKNISMIELSEEIGVSQSTISDWENGKKMPRSGSIQKLADFFQVQKTELLSEYRSEPNEKSKVTDTDLDDILDGVMSFRGGPLTDKDREAVRAFLEGRKSK